MAVEGAKTLLECRQLLKEKLGNCFARNDDRSDPRNRFARRGVTREIFEQDRLEHFLQLLCQDSADVPHSVVSANLKSIAAKIRGTTHSPHCYNNVLAILLYSQCKDESLVTFVECLLGKTPSEPTSDCDLPLAKSTACKAFGNDDGLKFWEQQYPFCPVILKDRDEVRYVASCPRPFLKDPENIGQGAYAIVYKVIIEKGHLINDQGVNDRNEYAMKEYIGYDAEAKSSYTKEATTIKQFIQCAKTHNNIATTKASLEWGNTYSLFFDLAKYDLSKYFTQEADTIKTLEDKRGVFSQTIGLAGALAYLHEELYLASTNEQLQCYHLDLKPQNILVFETNGKHIFKISDFGISQIKRVPFNQSASEHHLSILDRILQSRKPDKDPSPGVDNSRYGGTYAAPEAKGKSDTVTRKSDVWSLGCVITLILTFLHNPSQGIDQFQKARARDRSHDWFFDSKALKAGSENQEILHVSVLSWLDKLKEEAQKRDRSEAKATQMATELLRYKVFLRDQEERLSAKDVENELKKIQSSFTEEIGSPMRQSTTRESTSAKRVWQQKLLHFAFLTKGSHKNKGSQHSWPFDMPNPPKQCKFSADGRYLCIASNDFIDIKSVSGIQQRQASQGNTSLTPPEDKRWAQFSVGSKYLCAALESENFEISYLPLSTEDTVDKVDVCTNVKCRIQKVVISPNDQITAFVLQDSQQEVNKWRLALYHTQDLLDLPTSRSASVNTHGSSSASKSSTITNPLGSMPWKDIMGQSRDLEMPIRTQLADLKFSSNGEILMGITEPFSQQGTQGMRYEVFTWNLISGRKLSTLENHTTGYDGMGVSWAVDTFAVFATQPSFVSISRKKIRWGDYNLPEYKSQSKILGDELLDILVTEEEDEVILVGRSNGKTRIDAFRVSTSKIKGLVSLGQGLPTGSHRYNRATDCCCLSERDDKLAIMVATVNPRRREGRLYEKFLE